MCCDILNKVNIRVGVAQDTNDVLDILYRNISKSFNIKNEEVRKIVVKSYLNNKAFLSKESFLKFLNNQNQKDLIFLVAERDHKVIGFSMATITSQFIAKIFGVYSLSKEEQLEDEINELLLKETEELLFGKNAKGIFMREIVDRIPFFTKNGYTIISHCEKILNKEVYYIYKDNLLNINQILKKTLKLLDQGQYCEASKAISVIVTRLSEVIKDVVSFDSVLSLSELVSMLCEAKQLQEY